MPNTDNKQLKHGKKVLLHIGTGKTGSTSIQRVLYQNKYNLSGVTYPCIKAHGLGQHYISLIYQPLNKVSRADKGKFKTESEFLDYTKELKKQFISLIQDKDKLLISSEFFEIFNIEELIEFRKTLEQYGYTEFKIVVYIREPVSYYCSLLQQQIKASHRIVQPKYKYPFKTLIDMCENVFGNDITVVPFEKKQLYQGDVVKDFIKHCSDFFGTFLSADKINYDRANESLSCEATYLVQMYREKFHAKNHNKSMPDSNHLVNILTKEIPSDGYHNLSLLPHIKKFVCFNHLKDMQWLKNKFSVTLNKYDYTCDNKGLDEIDVNKLKKLEHVTEKVDIKKLYHLAYQVEYYLNSKKNKHLPIKNIRNLKNDIFRTALEQHSLYAFIKKIINTILLPFKNRNH